MYCKTNFSKSRLFFRRIPFQHKIKTISSADQDIINQNPTPHEIKERLAELSLNGKTQQHQKKQSNDNSDQENQKPNHNGVGRKVILQYFQIFLGNQKSRFSVSRYKSKMNSFYIKAFDYFHACLGGQFSKGIDRLWANMTPFIVQWLLTFFISRSE